MSDGRWVIPATVQIICLVSGRTGFESRPSVHLLAVPFPVTWPKDTFTDSTFTYCCYSYCQRLVTVTLYLLLRHGSKTSVEPYQLCYAASCKLSSLACAGCSCCIIVRFFCDHKARNLVSTAVNINIQGNLRTLDVINFVFNY